MFLVYPLIFVGKHKIDQMSSTAGAGTRFTIVATVCCLTLWSFATNIGLNIDGMGACFETQVDTFRITAVET